MAIISTDQCYGKPLPISEGWQASADDDQVIKPELRETDYSSKEQLAKNIQNVFLEDKWLEQHSFGQHYFLSGYQVRGLMGLHLFINTVLFSDWIGKENNVLATGTECEEFSIDIDGHHVWIPSYIPLGSQIQSDDIWFRETKAKYQLIPKDWLKHLASPSSIGNVVDQFYSYIGSTQDHDVVSWIECWILENVSNLESVEQRAMVTLLLPYVLGQQLNLPRSIIDKVTYVFEEKFIWPSSNFDELTILLSGGIDWILSLIDELLFQIEAPCYINELINNNTVEYSNNLSTIPVFDIYNSSANDSLDDSLFSDLNYTDLSNFDDNVLSVFNLPIGKNAIEKHKIFEPGFTQVSDFSFDRFTHNEEIIWQNFMSHWTKYSEIFISKNCFDEELFFSQIFINLLKAKDRLLVNFKRINFEAEYKNLVDKLSFELFILSFLECKTLFYIEQNFHDIGLDAPDKSDEEYIKIDTILSDLTSRLSMLFARLVASSDQLIVTQQWAIECEVNPIIELFISKQIPFDTFEKMIQKSLDVNDSDKWKFIYEESLLCASQPYNLNKLLELRL